MNEDCREAVADLTAGAGKVYRRNVELRLALMRLVAARDAFEKAEEEDTEATWIAMFARTGDELAALKAVMDRLHPAAAEFDAAWEHARAVLDAHPPADPV